MTTTRMRNDFEKVKFFLANEVYNSSVYASFKFS